MFLFEEPHLARLFSKTLSLEFNHFYNPYFLLLSTFICNNGEGGGGEIRKGLTINLLLSQFNNFRPFL